MDSNQLSFETSTRSGLESAPTYTGKFSKQLAHIFILILVFSTYVSIRFDIWGYRQALGAFAFGFLPGFLILRQLRGESSRGVTWLFSFGISIAFLIFGGLALDQGLYYLLTIERPLRTPILTNTLIFVLVALVIGSYSKSNESIYSVTITLPTKKEFIILFSSVSLIGYTLFSINMANIYRTNSFLISVYLFVSALVFVVLWSDIPRRLYPLILFLIGIIHFLPVSLQSDYLVGSDIFRTYWIFNHIDYYSHWSVLAKDETFMSSLSVNFLPVIINRLFGIDSQKIFKIILPLIFSVSSLSIYNISQNILNSKNSFLATFLFISSHQFLIAPINPRTMIAILFVSLIVLVLVNTLSRVWTTVLFVLFSSMVVVSHYTTAYILLFILSVSIFIKAVLSAFQYLVEGRYSIPRSLSVSKVAIFAIFFFLWNNFSSIQVLLAGIDLTILNFLQPTSGEGSSRSTNVGAALGESILNKGIPAQIEFIASWLVVVGFLIGLIFYLKEWIGESNKRSISVDLQFVFSISAFLTLATFGFFPYVSKAYSLQRTYIFVAIVLAPVCIFGWSRVIHRFDLGSWSNNENFGRMIILLMVIALLLSNAGVTYHLAGESVGHTLSADDEIRHGNYIYNTDYHAAKWLTNNYPVEWSDAQQTRNLIYTDRHGKIIKMVGHPTDHYTHFHTGVRQLPQSGIEEIDGFVYFRYTNVRERKVRQSEGNFISINNYIPNEHNRIYSNGYSLVYRS